MCNAIVNYLVAKGKTREEALKQFWLVDDKGLLTENREGIQYGQHAFARGDETELEGTNLRETVDRVKPHILLGLCGVGGLFTEPIVRSLAEQHHHPIIFAMSNPTHLSECTAEQAYQWTDGRVIFACGSPFPPVEVTTPEGDVRQVSPSQGNNMFIFPGIGLGIVGSRSRRVTTEMMTCAAEALASCVTDENLASGNVFPSISDIRQVSLKVAVAVAEVAEKRGLANRTPIDGNWHAFLEDLQWRPEYFSLVHRHAK